MCSGSMNCGPVRVAAQLTDLEAQQLDHIKQRRFKDKNQVCGDSSISARSGSQAFGEEVDSHGRKVQLCDRGAQLPRQPKAS